MRMNLFCRKTLPHPHDGPWAWFVCFCCALTSCIVCGQMLTYGILLPVFMKEFNTSKGVTAWIGTLAMAIGMGSGPLSLKLIALFGERPVGIVSGFAAAGLVFACSFAKNISVLFIAYGILYGICANCIFSSNAKGLQNYFKKHLGAACGLETAGDSVGIILFSPLLQTLVDSLGWRTALQVLSGVAVLAGLAYFPFDPNVESDKDDKKQSTTAPHGRNFDCSIWKSPSFTITSISISLSFLSLDVALIHLVTFAEERNIPPSKSSLLYIFTAITSTIMRIGIGKIIDKKWLTAVQSIQLSAYIIGVSIICLTLARAYFHFILCMLCYGIGNGIFVSASYAFLLTCFKDPKKSYLGLTMCNSMSSLGVLCGAPIAGFCADIFNSYIPSFYIFGGLIIFSGTLPFVLLLIKQREENTEFEQQLQLIGSRLARAESSQMIHLHL